MEKIEKNKSEKGHPHLLASIPCVSVPMHKTDSPNSPPVGSWVILLLLLWTFPPASPLVPPAHPVHPTQDATVSPAILLVPRPPPCSTLVVAAARGGAPFSAFQRSSPGSQQLWKGGPFSRQSEFLNESNALHYWSQLPNNEANDVWDFFGE